MIVVHGRDGHTNTVVSIYWYSDVFVIVFLNIHLWIWIGGEWITFNRSVTLPHMECIVLVRVTLTRKVETCRQMYDSDTASREWRSWGNGETKAWYAIILHHSMKYCSSKVSNVYQRSSTICSNTWRPHPTATMILKRQAAPSLAQIESLQKG